MNETTLDRTPPRQVRSGRRSPVAVDLVTAHVRGLIEQGELRPGDRLPTERELAAQIGVSRPTVRTGLRTLSTMGVVQSKQGAGTFITAGPPALASEPLGLLAALHGLGRDGLFEARLVLEVGSSALAADRASGDDVAAMSEEVTGMFASVDEPITEIVPASEIGHPDHGAIWLKVNGQVRQQGDLNQMIWKTAEQVAIRSRYFELQPGDVIFTGTPSGVGPVKRGDELEGFVEGVGSLRLRVV